MGASIGVIQAPATNMIPAILETAVAGHLVGVVAMAAIVGVAGITGIVFRPPVVQNPTIADIQAIQLAKQRVEFAENLRLRAEQQCNEARVRRQEADNTVIWAARERMRAQMEYAQGEATRLTWKIEDERKRSQRLHEDTQRVMREEVERVQREANEHRRRAEEAVKAAHTAAEELQKAKEAKEDAERRLRQGIQSITVIPTPEALTAAKQRMQYQENLFHFAIAGVSGSGKSSLVNSFRGLNSRDAGAAAVGVTETTLQMTRYPDANKPFVWYDAPGAGTLNRPDWQYFNEQGLYVFDCIVVVFDNRFTSTDVAILRNARGFDIPTFIVRSKADQHIENIMKEMGYNNRAKDKEAVRRRLYKPARDQFVEKTRNSVWKNLKDASLPDQRVYIVSRKILLSIVQNKIPNEAIDEIDLVKDALSQVYRRRGGQSGTFIEEAQTNDV